MLIESETTSSIDAYLHKVNDAVTEFRSSFLIEYIVSISGGADESNLSYCHAIIDELIKNLENTHCAILTGGTKGGVPEIATGLARQYLFPTIGVFPLNGRKYALLDQLDLAIETLPPSLGSASFGSESYTFAQLPNYAVFIGGSYGTLIEAVMMMKINTKRVKDGQKPIIIIPIAGSGGVSETIISLLNSDARLIINSGHDAAEHIHTHFFEF